MGFLAGDTRADVSWSPLDERWYSTLGVGTSTGIAVSAETILQCDVVLAALRFKAYGFAMMSPDVFERQARGKRYAFEHRVYRLLRAPNAWQTAFFWQQSTMMQLSSWGNAYSLIDGDQLTPVHPSLVRVTDQRPDGTLVYRVRRKPDAPEETLFGGSEVLHFRDVSTDGQSGLPIYQLIRNVVGIALAAERHAAVFLRKGTRLSGILSTDQAFSAEARKLAEDSWVTNFGGPEAEGKVALMGGGLKFQPISIDHRNAQFLELRDFQVQSALRALGVPGVAIGYTGDKASTYASAKEFYESGGITHCLLPITTNIEQQLGKDLLFDDPRYFVRYNMAALVRGSWREQMEVMLKAAGRPILSGNEARETLDMNPADDETMDSVLMPVNVRPNEPEEPPELQPAPRLPAEDTPEDDAEDSAALALEAARERQRAERFVRAQAERLVRREIAKLTQGRGDTPRAAAFAADPAGWRAWVTDLYARHEPVVAEQMMVSAAQARVYCEAQRNALIAGGLGVVDEWERTAAERLARLAMEAA